MFLYDKVFYGCAFFLLGVFLFSIFNSFYIILLVALFGSAYFIFLKKYGFLLLMLFLAVGAVYYYGFNFIRDKIYIPFNSKSEVSGIVENVEHHPASQDLVASLGDPYVGKIKIYAKPYPRFEYGDQIKISGSILPILEEQKDYYAKDGIFGTGKFPEIRIIARNQGNPLKSVLIGIKEAIISVFSRSLPVNSAALISGITIGEREGFSQELKDKMSLSGTTHLVALSGYNISIIALVIAGIFGSFASQTIAFYLTVIFIILFVMMTGAEASAVRAAIMGIIALLAEETQRQFSMRNAIIFAAFGMVLVNPRVLVFDLGFQLSFAALLGIVYIVPAIQKIIGSRQPGFLSWKKNAITTLAAQLAVFPLLLGRFGIVSLTSLIANILILEAMPTTMALGFIMAGIGFFSDFFARMAGLAVNIFLSYELWIIDIFSRISLPITAESFGFSAAIVYYLILIYFVYKFSD